MSCPPLTVCYVLSYKAPQYIRTLSLVNALRRLSFVKLYTAINDDIGLKRYLETLRKVRKIRDSYKPDIYILGFRGHEIYWPLRKLVGDKPIIFDSLMSPFDALRSERKFGIIGRLAATPWRPLEQSILHDAQLILTDTQLHVHFLSDTYDLPLGKLLALPVGAIEPTAEPTEKAYDIDSELSVLFYGSFLPLHGINVILQAAQQLEGLPIRFDFIGGKRRDQIHLDRSFSGLAYPRHTSKVWVPFHNLMRDVIPNTDICLGGPFGNTNQAKRVVTGKTSQCLALGRPTVVGAIDEDYGLVDKENCLLVDQGNPDSLAASLAWACKNRDELAQIGARGRKLYGARFSIEVIKQKLGKALLDFH